jgi:serine/threonine protein kinase
MKRSRKKNKKTIHKGGKLINSSSHSCLFRPNLTIKNKKKSKKKISKIVFKPSDKEYEINKLINKLSNHENYYSILQKEPNMSYTEIKKQEKDIDECLNKFKLHKEDIFDSELLIGEWISGGNLQEYFNKKFKTHNIHKIEQIFLNMMDKFINVFIGIIILNENDIVHLDIKPSNIMVDKNTFKIIDFGLSSKLDDIDHFKQRAYKESRTDRLYIWYPPSFLLSQLDMSELKETEKYINNYKFNDYKSNAYVYNNIRKFYGQNTIRTYIQTLMKKIKYSKNKTKEEIDKRFISELDTIDTYSLGMIFPYLFEKKGLLKYVKNSIILRPFFELFKLMINPGDTWRIRIYEATVLLNSLIVINSNKKVLPITERIRKLLSGIEKNKL